MTLYVFMAAVQVVCLFKDPEVTKNYKQNCVEFHVNCAVSGGTHVEEDVFNTCKERAKKCDFETEGWLECKDKSKSK